MLLYRAYSLRHHRFLRRFLLANVAVGIFDNGLRLIIIVSSCFSSTFGVPRLAGLPPPAMLYRPDKPPFRSCRFTTANPKSDHLMRRHGDFILSSSLRRSLGR